MSNVITFKLLRAATVAAFIGFVPAPASAAPADYHFELVDQTIHAGEKVPVRVRLMQMTTGKAITNANMEEPKIAMHMAGMADMPGHVVKMSPDADGNYRVAADVVAPGEWILDLTAQVPEEKGSVQGSLKLQVVK